MISKASLSLSSPNFSGMVPQAPLVADRFSSLSAVYGRRTLMCALSSRRATKWPKTRLMVLISSDHTRAPTTSDDESGEVSYDGGGILDGSPISSEVAAASGDMRSGRATAEGSRSINSFTSVRNSDSSSKQHSRRLTQGFERLKHQRVKSLSRKGTWTKQEINPRDCDEQVVSNMSLRTSTASCSDNEFMGGKSTETSSRLEGSDPMATKSYQRRDARQIRLPKLDEPESKVLRPDISASRVSATSTRGWGNMESIQKIESRMPEHQNRRKLSSSERDFFSHKTFMELGCSEYMIESLRGQLVLRPSHIQAMAFGPVVEGQSCIIADQSGSGKTLSYLVPIIQRLRQEELQGLSKSFSKRPRAVVLVPTAELASQVLNDCRSISKFGVPFRSMVATGGFHQRTQLENLENDVDVLIATPGRLIFLINEGALQLTNLRCAVLDEVDILFKDEDFEPALQRLINSSLVSTQYLFVTATLPKEVYNKLVEVFPDCEVISGPGVHRISPRLEEVLVDCSGTGPEKTPVTAFINKKSALLQLVEKSPVSKTIVFCNKIETCRKVENVLKRFDRRGSFMRVLPFHSALTPESRLANLKEFLNSESQDSLFLVCTDRASRGIDFAGVDHVVLFDFPRDPSEYVRRVGRTARGARGSGKAFIYVVGKQVSLARRIMERNQKGHPLHDVPFMDQVIS